MQIPDAYARFPPTNIEAIFEKGGSQLKNFKRNRKRGLRKAVKINCITPFEFKFNF